MRYLFLTFILFISFQSASFAQKTRLNSIGLDYGGYAVLAPYKASVESRKNIYMNSSSSIVGLFYERFLEKKPFSFKAGAYLNKQFESVISYHFPLEASGRLVGRKLDNPIFIGYTAGLSYNYISEIVTGFALIPEGVSYDITIKKNSYIVPHVGINAGINLKKIRLTGAFLYHPFVPKFVEYETSYQKNGEKTTEYHNNRNRGLALRIGLGYKF